MPATDSAHMRLRLYEDLGTADGSHYTLSWLRSTMRGSAHLFLGTAADNTADMSGKDRGWWQRHGRGPSGRNMGAP